MSEISSSGTTALPRKGEPCVIEDCGKPVLGRGWCAMHYGRWRKYGDPLHETRRYVAQGEKCTAPEGCDRKPKYDNLCGKHVERQVAHGETTDPRERNFWAQVDRHGPDGCWPWTGYVHPKTGYGQFGVRKGTRLPHRIAYEFLVGPIPEGLVLDHLCHTREPQCADTVNCPHRKCCNPAHLEPVTPRENLARGRGGDSWGYVPLVRLAKPVQLTLTVCANGCAKPLYKRDLCRPCYRKWLKDPDVERPSQRTREQRFWAKVGKNGPVPEHRPDLGPCWLWTAGINKGTGYGMFALRHGQMMDAHRFSCELANGPIPEKHDVHHLCHVRSCVNPLHLQAIPRAENRAMHKDRRAI